MIVDLRWCVLTIVNILLIISMHVLNDALSPFSLYLFMSSLLIVSPSMYLSYRSGLVCVLLSSFFFDAACVYHFGQITPLFLLAHALIYLLRERFKRHHAFHSMLLNFAINALLFAVAAFLFAPEGSLTEANYWLSLALHFILSQALILPLAYYIHILEHAVLCLLHLEVDSEEYVV